MYRSARLVVPILALGLLAAAGNSQTQTRVVPPEYATLPGNSLDIEPLGYDQIRHAQFVERGELKGLGTGAKLSEIRYRREEHRLDKIYTQYEPMKRGTVVIPAWQIRVGNFTGTLANLNPQYANSANKTTWTTVFAGKLNYTVNTPTLSAPSSPTTPAPFAMRFPFNVATLTYGGAGIAIEHLAYESRNRSHIYYVDSVESQPGSGGSVDLISKTSLGCPSGFNRVHGSAPNPGGGRVKLNLFGAPANAPTICYFGATATNINLGFMQMPACNLYTQLVIGVPVAADFAGIADLRVRVPASPAYAGASIYNQWGVADQRVNPSMGFAMSDGVKITLGTKVGVETIDMAVISGYGQYANYNYGFLQMNRGAVFQLVY